MPQENTKNIVESSNQPRHNRDQKTKFDKRLTTEGPTVKIKTAP